MHPKILIVALLLLSIQLFAGRIRSEEVGTWCRLKKAPYYHVNGQEQCCQEAEGKFGRDNRCFGLEDNRTKCTKFLECCKNKFQGANQADDECV